MSQEHSNSQHSSRTPGTKSPLLPQGLPNYMALNSSFLFLYNQNQLLLQENRSLRAQAQQEEGEKRAAQVQNTQLRRQVTTVQEIPRRKYSKRRSWLQKKFKCGAISCNSAYSSKIALNLHTRKRHNTLLKIEA